MTAPTLMSFGARGGRTAMHDPAAVARRLARVPPAAVEVVSGTRSLGLPGPANAKIMEHAAGVPG